MLTYKCVYIWSGDEVCGYDSYLHIPEEYLRSFNEKQVQIRLSGLLGLFMSVDVTFDS